MSGNFLTAFLIATLVGITGVAYAQDREQSDSAPLAGTEDGKGNDLEGPGDLGERAFGIGLLLGNPSGLCAKYYFDRWNALAGAAGYWSGPRVLYLRLHLDYLYHPGSLVATPDIDLRFYFGGGLKFASVTQEKPNDNPASYGALGVRAPLGLLLNFKGAPLDVFAELAPATYFLPAYYPDLDFGVGARYFFQ